MSQSIPYELYNPSLSIQENAKRLGCSASSIRKYLKSKKIDRRFDASYVKWKRIHDYARLHPGSTWTEKSKELGYAINTIKKYLSLKEEDLIQSKRDTDKVSNFDIWNHNQARSVSKSQDEILFWILNLYNDHKPFDADLTASLMKFYTKVPKPNHLYDINPQSEEVHPLSQVEALPDGYFSSLVFDLPFLISGYTNSVLNDRFSYFKSREELLDTNTKMLSLSHRLLAKKGILVVKTMDINHGGQQVWVSDYVLNTAKEMGFELLDKFILIATQKLLRKTHTQSIARKYHSYFFVFRKR